MNKVFVCIPSHNYWRPRMGASLVGLVRISREVSASCASETKENITKAKNDLAWKAKKSEASHILWVGADVCFPYNALHRLMAHEKKVVWALPRPWKESDSKLFENENALKEGGLQKISTVAPMVRHALCLVSIDVYDLYPFPWYYEQYGEDAITDGNLIGHVPEDQVFGENLFRSEIDIFCDVDLSKETYWC